MLFRECVEFIRGDVQKRRHLVDERAGAARAGSVHTHLKAGGVIAVRKEQNLRVLAAKFDDRIRTRHKAVHRNARRVHLLHELNVTALCKTHTGRAGNAQKHLFFRKLLCHFTQHLNGFLHDARKMTLIFFEKHLVLLVQNNAL